jgi:hypothetical protein
MMEFVQSNNKNNSGNELPSPGARAAAQLRRLMCTTMVQRRVHEHAAAWCA